MSLGDPDTLGDVFLFCTNVQKISQINRIDRKLATACGGGIFRCFSLTYEKLNLSTSWDRKDPTSYQACSCGKALSSTLT